MADPLWCSEHLGKKLGDNVTVIQVKPSAPAFLLMHQMARYSLQVISNSTFSWWAAWLGEKPGQQVLLPDRWYAQGIKAPIEEKMPSQWSVVIKHR